MNHPTSPRWLRADEARLDDLRSVLSAHTDPAGCPQAARLLGDVPVYDCASLRERLARSVEARDALMAEWAWVWEEGPGILVLQGAVAAPEVDAVTARFQDIIDRERSSSSGGDHFAKAGANDRVWNALEKLCRIDPVSFARYYANDMIALASQAWLGPAYQITSQVNNVRPGGAAQTPHRDYHLGFCSPAQAERYPAHVHRLSPMLTLQGAVAHVDMPLESGPTLYLPHSQKYAHGYLLADRDDFRAHFAEHRVQLPLGKGDAVFFNPALLHAAGENRSHDIQRMANLLQVSSAFGRAMESVDRDGMSRTLYPHLLAMLGQGELDGDGVDRAVAACAEGYAFPTNLDRDPPLGGLAPESPQAVMRRALREGWTPEQWSGWLDIAAHKRLT
ncbi:phytanoyl-CoA dioxygenase family protein [Sphaerotilus mobilis]|uniref:Ectoine hydroxylase-related dioxygenase (Phytanoyl-CoA dioxygenase family) n=1 Tax=Sphaerotilus mobilis TaxID=47994 RepID=A0A4Q7L8C4_9BURK|nr:phytanoyl-CoA dioxygenase family protein [Sphaerotilus mobilis]RZS46658.1 ectoine hydroxylase-related dioxygenase (phytanoyl-CoA dioxygenase family) [Sphaerotilus mobilis]